MSDDVVQRNTKSTKSIGKILAIILAIVIFGVVCGIAGYYTNDGGSEQPTTQETPPVNEIDEDGEYYIGIWKNDVTGPVSEVNMMGYASPGQNAGGLHTRLYSRAFIIADKTKTTRVCFVSIDYGMTSQKIKLRVIQELKKEFGDLYTEKNVVLSGTHTHSATGGFFEYALFEVTSKGTVAQSTEAYIEGIVRSIRNAHSKMRLGNIYAMSGQVDEANINRSPSSYLLNPQEERDRYDFDTDHEMTLLRFDSSNGGRLGAVTWFPVHPTSMNKSNLLISSDNKGRASMLFEKMMRNEGETMTGKESFVAAFASANLGDVSPNTMGPICINNGWDCDFESSTCRVLIDNPITGVGIPAQRAQYCVASGPGKDMFESTDIIGTRQFEAAASMYHGPTRDVVSGPISYAHQYVDMSREEVTLANGSKVTTCKAALGYSFAAGCTDGAGALNFNQGTTTPQPFWEAVRSILIPLVTDEMPDEEFVNCQQPKPVLFPTGYMNKPYQWHPHILDVQILRIGQILIAAVPGEFSTMAGRRLKEAIKQRAVEAGMPANTMVMISGLSNVYSHYMVTYEEYQAQRYEAASTLFGPHTAEAYTQRYTNLAEMMIKGNPVDPGTPPVMPDGAPEYLSRPKPDFVPEGYSYGNLVQSINSSYLSGQTVSATFYGANPRHNIKLGGTYLEVHKKQSDGSWRPIYRDSDWETKFIWKDVSTQRNVQDKNIITAVIDIVAATSGFKLNLELAQELFDKGELKVPQFTSKSDHRRFQDEMILNGVLEPYSSPRADFGTAESHVTIEWAIPKEQSSGTYRIAYFGDYYQYGEVIPIVGYSTDFEVQRIS